MQQISPTLDFEHWSVQHLGSLYTDFAFLAYMTQAWGKNIIDIFSI